VASFLESGAKMGAGAEEERADGGVGFADDAADFGGVELVDGGEEQDLALVFGEGVDGAEDGGEALGLGEGDVRGEIRGDERLGEERVHLVGADAAAAVEGEVPGNADEPGAEIADDGELSVVFEDADEDVLHGVLGFGLVAEDGVGYSEEERSVGFNERGEVRCRGSDGRRAG
jgi:hypothetical protein